MLLKDFGCTDHETVKQLLYVLVYVLVNYVPYLTI